AWRDQPLARRGFLRVTAASAATVALITAGCGTDTPTPVAPDPFLLNLPAQDNGLLYYVYLLAIAKAALYQKVVDAPASDLTATDRTLLAHMRDHEVIYRELWRYLINPDRTQVLFPTDFAVNLSSLNLTTRAGVLAAAKTFEDLTAAAYPPILSLVANTYYQTLMRRVASAQARTSASVRDLLAPGSFADADVVGPDGLQITQTPTQVNTVLAPYFAPYVVSVANLPIPV
ncbi:MAG: ferritin-like domain-containing protein, partial [Bacteroidota bacterium]|nr:ferritin-like domain-containing protein [Bacteroidota bacterium]